MIEKQVIIDNLYLKDNIKNIDQTCWIYFLVDYKKTECDFDILYIGKTHSLYDRILQHRKAKKIPFNSFFIIKCEDSSLDMLEQQYIYEYNPYYNIIFNKRWWFVKIKELLKEIKKEWTILRKSTLNTILKDIDIPKIIWDKDIYYSKYYIINLLK